MTSGMFQTAAALLDTLKVRGLHLATSESLTGGSIGQILTAVPGASAVYNGGIISYTNAIKNRLLGVPTETLDTYGAVSEPVALAMAQGAAQALGADVALSTTGLAGPTGDDRGNPVGTVCIGVHCQGKTFARTFHFDGDREAVRSQAVEMALLLALGELAGK